MKKQFMGEAIRLAAEGVARGDGGPFGALIVRGGEILGRGWNRVLADHDPTAHAEMIAIRQAASRLGEVHLTGCILYTSCEPCPMCLSAAYWAHIDHIVFGATATDVSDLGFDDQYILRELEREPVGRRVVMEQLMRGDALEVFSSWRQSGQQMY
jgi:tRNA(Arg) A34 adenosine deaminase TadA